MKLLAEKLPKILVDEIRLKDFENQVALYIGKQFKVFNLVDKSSLNAAVTQSTRETTIRSNIAKFLAQPAFQNLSETDKDKLGEDLMGAAVASLSKKSRLASMLILFMGRPRASDGDDGTFPPHAVVRQGPGGRPAGR